MHGVHQRWTAFIGVFQLNAHSFDLAAVHIQDDLRIGFFVCRHKDCKFNLVGACFANMNRAAVNFEIIVVGNYAVGKFDRAVGGVNSDISQNKGFGKILNAVLAILAVFTSVSSFASFAPSAPFAAAALFGGTLLALAASLAAAC